MQPSKSGAAMPARDLYGTRIPSPRQHQIIELVAQGLKNSEVAEIIGTTEYVVKNYLRVIFDKLGLWNRVELALWYEARRHESLADGQRRRAMA
jgi:DNA-binding NarL/FixJ family response regulator